MYYLHNRVDTIEECAARVGKMVPGARIGIAHGKMTEEQISSVWQQLLDNEIDILVCTTLIETGVDVRNCNTLIIENADRMGLSQLYQIRGRVGRSSRRAYAYFTFTRDKVLTEVAAKRLSAIREFTSFGSGFRIAMRDLQIRGAGSLLGHSQHGHMEAVGYDLYVKMLGQAIATARGEAPPPDKSDCLVDITVDAFLPEDYIPDAAGRIEAYKRIAAIETTADAEDVLDELIDRYGSPPKKRAGAGGCLAGARDGGPHRRCGNRPARRPADSLLGRCRPEAAGESHGAVPPPGAVQRAGPPLLQPARAEGRKPACAAAGCGNPAAGCVNCKKEKPLFTVLML